MGLLHYDSHSFCSSLFVKDTFSLSYHKGSE